MEPEESPADLAHRIMNADKPSAPVERKLRLQWNVPEGVTPYVPLWFVGVFAVIALVAIVDGLLH